MSIFGIGVLFGSYYFAAIKRYIEFLTYLFGVGIFAYYTYMCALDLNTNVRYVHIEGLLAIGPIITIAIVSRPFLYLWSIGVSLFSIVEACYSFGNDPYFLFWINVITMVGMSSYFSLQRIKGIEKIEESRAEDQRKSKEIQDLYELAAQAAHDIRSPVTALEMVYRTLDENAPGRGLIQGSIKRINNIAENMLEANRRGRNSQVITAQSLDGNIDSVLNELATEIKVRHPAIELTVNISPETPERHALKSTDLYRIVSNLINNAVEAEATLIDLSTTVENNRIKIKVRDNGRGILIENQKNLFKRGFTFGKKAGNGLGLFGARQILTSIGGDINLTSQPGVGTEVTISFMAFCE